MSKKRPWVAEKAFHRGMEHVWLSRTLAVRTTEDIETSVVSVFVQQKPLSCTEGSNWYVEKEQGTASATCQPFEVVSLLLLAL